MKDGRVRVRRKNGQITYLPPLVAKEAVKQHGAVIEDPGFDAKKDYSKKAEPAIKIKAAVPEELRTKEPVKEIKQEIVNETKEEDLTDESEVDPLSISETPEIEKVEPKKRGPKPKVK